MKTLKSSTNISKRPLFPCFYTYAYIYRKLKHQHFLVSVHFKINIRLEHINENTLAWDASTILPLIKFCLNFLIWHTHIRVHLQNIRLYMCLLYVYTRYNISNILITRIWALFYIFLCVFSLKTYENIIART